MLKHAHISRSGSFAMMFCRHGHNLIWKAEELDVNALIHQER